MVWPKLMWCRQWHTARQGLRALRPTSPAGPNPSFGRAVLRRPDTGQRPGLCTLAHSPGDNRLRIQARQGTGRTEPDIVVTVGRHVPVTIGGTHVHSLIVERADAQHTAKRSSPCGRDVRGTAASAVDSSRSGGAADLSRVVRKWSCDAHSGAAEKAGRRARAQLRTCTARRPNSSNRRTSAIALMAAAVAGSGSPSRSCPTSIRNCLASRRAPSSTMA